VSPTPPVPSGVTRRSVLRTGIAAGAGLVAAACGSSKDTGRPTATGRPTPTANRSSASPVPTTTTPPGPPDPAEIKANELGYVPVMMYHRITTTVEGEFDTTPKDFRAGLHRLFSSRYRPVRTIDLVRGDFPVAAGYTPVVLTFDDGYSDQFAVSPTGEVDPASGVGILLDVCKEYPDCPPAGSFNINKNPFTFDDAAHQRVGLRKLHELGFEIANHTYNHDNLAALTNAGVQKDFVRLQRLVEDAVPGASVLTMALPFGVSPHDKALAHTGSWHGSRYVNEGVLLVGSNPSHSPFSAKFQPLAIPRMRSTSWQHGKGEFMANYWLDYLDHHKELRYVAAGNPGHVTIPKDWLSGLDRRFRARVVTY